MVVTLGNVVHRITVKPGPEGMKEFQRKIRRLFNIPEGVEFEVRGRKERRGQLHVFWPTGHLWTGVHPPSHLPGPWLVEVATNACLPPCFPALSGHIPMQGAHGSLRHEQGSCSGDYPAGRHVLV